MCCGDDVKLGGVLIAQFYRHYLPEACISYLLQVLSF
jgi:hypothetical protein